MHSCDKFWTNVVLFLSRAVSFRRIVSPPFSNTVLSSKKVCLIQIYLFKFTSIETYLRATQFNSPSLVFFARVDTATTVGPTVICQSNEDLATLDYFVSHIWKAVSFIIIKRLLSRPEVNQKHFTMSTYSSLSSEASWGCFSTAAIISHWCQKNLSFKHNL